jgi:hypothetical protein
MFSNVAFAQSVDPKQKFDYGFYDKIQQKIQTRDLFHSCLDKVETFSNDEIFVYDPSNTTYDYSIDPLFNSFPESPYVYVKKMKNIYEKIKNNTECKDLLVVKENGADKTIGDLIDKNDYHTTIILVNRDQVIDDNTRSKAHQNKEKVANELASLYDAKEIYKAETLSFVSARVPVEKISTLADYNEVHLLGDGEEKIDLALDVSKSVIKSNQVSFTGTGITVAVLDTGIEQGHIDLPIPSTVTTQIVCSQTSCPSSSTNYGDDGESASGTGHGTHVAGIIAGKGLGSSTKKGVAPNAKLFNVKMADIITVTVGKALDWSITNGARITNLSFGHEGFLGEYTTISLMADEAADLGAVVVVANGNEGPNTGSVFPPATGFNVMGIGNLNDNNNTTPPTTCDIATDSSRGPTDDGRIKPEIVAPGVNIDSPADDLFFNYWEESGTSISAPHVSGSAALLLEGHPELTSLEIKGALLAGATWYGPSSYTAVSYDSGFTSNINKCGFGLIDVQKSNQLVTEGNKIIKDTIHEGETKTYTLSVTSGVQTKIFLSWFKHPLGTVTNPIDSPISNLTLRIKDSSNNVYLESNSNVQNTEFTIFTPPVTSSSWKVEVISAGNIIPDQPFVIASTNSLVPQQTIECFPDDLTPYDWIVIRDCTLAKNTVGIKGNVIVQNGATLTIPSGKILNIDFANKHLLVKSGSGVLIKSGGKID